MVVENDVLVIISLIISDLLVNTVVAQNFEGYVVEGDFAGIREFPHAAFLYMECEDEQYQKVFYSCGSSILNQVILITAAHCLENCVGEYSFVTAFVGHKEKMQGLPYLGSGFKVHEKYDTDKISNDIGLVRLKKPLAFGKAVRRVSLLRDPPYDEPATVAGWGLIDEENRVGARYLMQLSQKVWSRADCMEELGESIPKGTICGGALDALSYVAAGDSGSALIVRKYIQIGLVSFKDPEMSNSLAVYTDIAFFYSWLKKTAKSMYCGEY